MDAKSRMKVVIDKKLCINCFRSDHFARSCRSKFTCKHCSKRHHSMIHPGPYELSSTIPEENAVKGSFTSRATNPGPSSVLTVSAVPTDSSPCAKTILHPTSVLLTTVVLIVVDAYGQEHVARVMLDTGSQPNAISERLCQQLHLSRRSVNVPIAGVDGTVTNAKHEVSAEVRSRLDFLVLRKVTCDTPSVPFSTSELELPDDIALADPDFGTPRRVDMIIGAAHFYSFLRKGKFRIANLLFIETVFGWIASGKIESNREHSKQAIATCHVATVVPIDELLQRFWQLEDVSASNYSVDEQNCENFYQNTVSRDPSGRYIVRMPKHPDFNKMIGESKAIAMRRLSWLDKRLQKNEELKIQYHAFMSEYISLGHMVPVPDDDEANSIRCYLPHHPVINQSSSTTKVRVVFDGSAKTSSGHSLNDALIVGPVVQDNILDIHLRFRMFMIALVADAEKMYRQVLMHPDDRSLQRILWPPGSNGFVQTYELCTVTYGLAPSSFLATRTLLQLAEDHGNDYPRATL
ncbi:uncharacterized protein LOC129766759 [Toxorhynchites rutilus septentrionalis]|uniref:uncharacterized protein LOC129766759 n=1 Tax=Toxorhynchites rutilus septentrionalis TaxID=329112 RepID=UPI002479C431|nr:uncharacterized protein LOC129766759 [Toxorhynchites rutilus septentrionalis]